MRNVSPFVSAEKERSDCSSTAFGLEILMKSVVCGCSLTKAPLRMEAERRCTMSPSLRCMFSIIQNGKYTIPSCAMNSSTPPARTQRPARRRRAPAPWRSAGAHSLGADGSGAQSGTPRQPALATARRDLREVPAGLVCAAAPRPSCGLHAPLGGAAGRQSGGQLAGERVRTV